MSDIQDKEYDRIAAEIRQNQAIRITLFTFSVTACAALLGLSEKIMAEKPVLMFGAVYVVLIPSIILVHHYTRSIDSLSEYLRIFHEEKWMIRFDTMTEGFAKYAKLGFFQRGLQRLKLYSTGWALAFAYLLLVIFVVGFGLLKFDTGIRSRLILLGGAVFTIWVLWLFRSLGKQAYREVWDKIRQNETSGNDVFDKPDNGQKKSKAQLITASSKRTYVIALLFAGIFIASTAILFEGRSGLFRSTPDTSIWIVVTVIISAVGIISTIILGWRKK